MKTLKKEVASYLNSHRSSLYAELRKAKKRMKRVVEYLKKEPHLLFVKIFYRLIKKAVLWWKKSLEKRIVVIKKNIREYKDAIKNLSQGNKNSVIRLLEKIKEKIPSSISLPANSEYGSVYADNPAYDKVNDLITELSATA